MGFREEGWKVPFYDPPIDEADVIAVAEAVRQKKLSQGSVVREFEEKLAKYLGCKYVVCCNSGTAALHLALVSLNISEGDEVVVPSFTFAATINSVLYVRAEPVFADIDSATYCIDPDDMWNKVTANTQAIIPVHLAGISADMDRIDNLAVVEDAAQAIGCKYKGKMVGTIGDVGAFSFYTTKSLQCAEGGALVTNNEEIATKARILRSHGQESRYKHIYLGYNYRMSDITASLGLSQLEKLDEIIEGKQKVALQYNDLLRDTEGVYTPQTASYSTHTYNFYILRCKTREIALNILDEAKKEGVEIIRAYMPVHKQPYLPEYHNIRLPVTDDYEGKTIFLPCWKNMPETFIGKVVEVVEKGCKNE